MQVGSVVHLSDMLRGCTPEQLAGIASVVGSEPSVEAIAAARASQLDEIQRAAGIRHMRTVLAARYEALRDAGGCCELCGATAKDGARLQVDHIKPVSRFPDLAADPSNMQVLCHECNMGKGNRFEDDWR